MSANLDRITRDLARLVAVPSTTGDEMAVQDVAAGSGEERPHAK